MMRMAWYVAKDGKLGGPFDDATIIGSIIAAPDPAIQICEAGSKQWRDMASHPPFAEALRRAMPPPAPPVPKKRQPATGAGIATVLFCGLMMGGLLFYMFDDAAGGWCSRAVGIGAKAPVAVQPPAPEHDKLTAWVMAQEFVKKQLKAPGTAEFGSLWKGDHQDPEKAVAHLGDGRYRAIGWVDAQNTFGAVLRQRFTITVRYVGDDNWQVEDGPVFTPW